MEAFFKENLETVMMVAFVLATALSIYKVYVMFEKQADDGIDIKTLEEEIIAIIEKIFQRGDNPAKKELLEQIRSDADFDASRYANLNENRLNQILDKLYMQKEVESYNELTQKLSKSSS